MPGAEAPWPFASVDDWVPSTTTRGAAASLVTHENEPPGTAQSMPSVRPNDSASHPIIGSAYPPFDPQWVPLILN